MIVNETLSIIQRRRSCRSFKNAQITEEELQAVLEAGLYAPHAGDQDWHFTVIQNKDILDRLNHSAKEAVKYMGIQGLLPLAENENFDCLYGAPTLIIVSGDEQSPIPLEADCAAAAQNLLLAAESIGLGSCWIFFVILAFLASGGDDLQKELIPTGYKPFNAVVLGYKQDAVIEVPARKPNLVTYIR